MSMFDRIEDKAKRAKDKKAALGIDVDLEGYEPEAKLHEEIEELGGAPS